MNAPSSIPCPNPAITVHCSVCDGTNVKRDAHAEWNDELQMWELSNVYDDAFCDDCGCAVSLIERLITA